MGLRWWGPLLLVASAFLLGGCTASSSHSLRYFLATTWDPHENLFRFSALGSVNDQVGGYYNAHTRIVETLVPWLKKLEKEDPHFSDWHTHVGQSSELRMKQNLMSLWKLYNHSQGLHTWQRMVGCDLGKDGRRSGFFQYAYNGEDFLSFDKETLTWTAAMVPAQVIKRVWDPNLIRSRKFKLYLEEECVEWLQKFLDYGKDSLLRRERPTVTVAGKASYNGLETLICRAHGFHPKEIDATWRKDGLVWEQETFRGGVTPNSDGTYHTWLSVTIDPKDRDRYRCHVDHDSLPEPLDLAWEEPASSRTWLIAGVLVGVATSVLLVSGIIVCIFGRRDKRGITMNNLLKSSRQTSDFKSGEGDFKTERRTEAEWAERNLMKSEITETQQ